MAAVLVEDGEEYIVDTIITDDNMKYIDTGTGVTGAQKSDTGMETGTAETRATGVMSESPNAQTIQVVGTVSFTGGHAVTEVGLFTHLAAGVLAIRDTHGAINVVNGDGIQYTIRLEIQ